MPKQAVSAFYDYVWKVLMKIIREHRHRYFLMVGDAILSFLTYAHNTPITTSVTKFPIAKKSEIIEFTKKYQRRLPYWFEIPFDILRELM